MKRIVAALALVCLSPALAPGQGLAIKRFRPAYSVPPDSLHGPTRVDAKNLKLVQGDVLYAEYAIAGLTTDTATGKVSYDIVLELIDAKGKNWMRRPSHNEAVPQLGGDEMPGDMLINFGDAFPVGKYTVSLSVTDRVGKKTVVEKVPIEVVPLQFAFVHVEALALALPGERVGIRCLVTGFALDAKKECNVDVTVRMLDANGKSVAASVQMNFPEALGKGVDRQNLTILPVVFPLTPNRPGQFYFELAAVDKNAKSSKNAKIELRVPLLVQDIGAVTGK